jgi:predicted secreted protein
MTPIVDKAASALRVAASIGLALLAAPALAGDRALFDPIGYSADGRYFAFEEFGIQDGSGFSYSNIYVIDIPADAWPSGTPVRLRLEEDAAPLIAAREQNREAAAPVLSGLEIAVPAQIVALIGDGEFDPEAASLSFGLPGYGPGEVREDLSLGLEIFDMPGARIGTEPCETYLDAPAKGYALTLAGDGEFRELHRDTGRLPASRGCATGYRLYGVVLPMNAQDIESGLAIISVYPHGFEGPDRRFIAVPLASGR